MSTAAPGQAAPAFAGAVSLWIRQCCVLPSCCDPVADPARARYRLNFRITVNGGLLPDPLIPESWRLRWHNLRQRLARWRT